ncbi:hypothetical protein FTUN_4585 [Frigoriglobus tundricola]|uniref:Uncharacterized protein n=1 Tax=Frigoriglobus tundricola TaxID=2774151 RepID=A0A6M5YSJ3_9BACT|nr:hypothetical protein FTUN_4585 [Frigoriglobus tundricola]
MLYGLGFDKGRLQETMPVVNPASFVFSDGNTSSDKLYR